MVWRSVDGETWERVAARRAHGELVLGDVRFGVVCDMHGGDRTAGAWMLCERVAADDCAGLASDGLCAMGQASLPVRLPLLLVRVCEGALVDVDAHATAPPITTDLAEEAVGSVGGEDTSCSEIARIATLARTLESASLLTGRSGNDSGNTASHEALDCASLGSD